MKIIDAHTNIGWDASNLRKNLIPSEQSYEALLARMDRYKVEKAITVPFPCPAAKFDPTSAWYDIENQYLMTAHNSSERLIPFIGVNPGDERSVEAVNTLVTAFGVKGVKFSHQTLSGFSIDGLIGHPLMERVQGANLIFMMHIGTGKEPKAREVNNTLDYAIKVAKHYPGIEFILCHLGRLHWSMLEALNLDNVHMDTAGLSLWHDWKEFIAREPMSIFEHTTPVEVLERLADLGHADRIIFGSDEPYTPYRDELENINKADIPEAAKRKILHKNIEGLLKGRGSSRV